MTLLRLAGERMGWSEVWFSRVTAGLVPASAVSWVVGITWLALPFGAYLAWRLARSGEAPSAPGRSSLIALAAAVFLYAAPRLVLPHLPLGFPSFLLAIWSVGVLAAALAWTAWPSLARVLLVYGLLSRFVVAVVMLVAMRGRWGTHYDYADVPRFQQMPFWSGFFWLAFFPQMVFWVSFTIVAGMLAGTLYAAVAGRARVRSEASGSRV
jgi:hypothetical protein